MPWQFSIRLGGLHEHAEQDEEAAPGEAVEEAEEERQDDGGEVDQGPAQRRLSNCTGNMNTCKIVTRQSPRKLEVQDHLAKRSFRTSRFDRESSPDPIYTARATRNRGRITPRICRQDSFQLDRLHPLLLFCSLSLLYYAGGLCYCAVFPSLSFCSRH